MAAPFATACVTGGAGFIGSHLVRRLLARGMRVRVIDNLSVGRREAVPDEVEFVHGDILDPAVAAQVCDCDVVFHLAARVAIRSSFDFLVEDTTTNVLGTATLLKAVAAAPERRVRRFLFASSMAVYPDRDAAVPIPETTPLEPISPYGVSKMAGEMLVRQVCEELGIDPVVLRLFNTYGTGQAFSPYVGVVTIFARTLLEGGTPRIFGDGEQRRDFVHVDDVARGFVAAMDHGLPGRVYNMGSGRGLTVNAVYRAVAAALGVDTPAEHVDAVPGEVRNSIADIARAGADLRYEPAHRFESSIGDVLGHMQAG
jgi:nucleoside-diphosphate-sugar epimerase